MSNTIERYKNIKSFIELMNRYDFSQMCFYVTNDRGHSIFKMEDYNKRFEGAIRQFLRENKEQFFKFLNDKFEKEKHNIAKKVREEYKEVLDDINHLEAV
jgi:hypothetical protein